MSPKRLVWWPVPRIAPLLLCVACASGGNDPYKAGQPAVDIAPGRSGPVSGVGIGGKDIMAMTDLMARDLLATPTIAGRSVAPRIIVDAAYFVNESSQPINKNLITDRLRVGLNRASQGRMAFVGRENAGMVEQERELKRSGTTDVGTTGLTRAQAGVDFRLTGRINALDSRSNKTGVIQRYNQITFEMVDLESGIIVWSGIYEFERAAADDVVYR